MSFSPYYMWNLFVNAEQIETKFEICPVLFFLNQINHFPGSFQIGRKDRLWKNLYKMQLHHGKKEYNFFPQTFVLPFDMKLLKRAWEDGSSKQKWILKPVSTSEKTFVSCG